MHNMNNNGRAPKKAQWVKVIAAKPDYPSSILRTNTMEGENQFPQVVLCPPPHMHRHPFRQINKQM